MESTNYNSNGNYDLGFTNDKGHIEHPVSKLDTLVGIAIKYGVEVADIKKMNGLATDLQMFARKSLQIPLPGKHPPSPCLANGSEASGLNNSEQIPPHNVQCDLFDSFQSLRLTPSPQQKVSPATSSLQGYYGLKPKNQMASESFREFKYLEDNPLVRSSPAFNSLALRQKSRSLANGLVAHNGELGDNDLGPYFGENESDKSNEKPFIRHQRSGSDFTSSTPEMLLKEENSTVSGFSAITGKRLAQRPKAANRSVLPAEGERGVLNPISLGQGDYTLAERFFGVRKSSSMSCLHDHGGSSSSSSIRPTSRWSLKPDLQAFSSGAITKPIFDGLPKPITGRRNKAAID